MISFGAKYINSVNIQKINRSNDLIEPCEVYCVELDPASDEDIDAMVSVSENWDSYWKFSELISNCMKYYSKYKDKLEGNKFYVITTQKEHLHHLEPSEVLAVSQIYKNDNDIKLKYLEVKPDDIELIKKPYVFNHIGSGMFNALKNIFSDKRIKLFSSSDAATRFYKANGFKESENVRSEMYYEA